MNKGIITHMGNKMRKNCIYCGKRATKRGDHIPSKNLFKGIGLDPIIIPSCKSCNEGLSQDEEYFRHIICMICNDDSIVANYIFETAIKRSMKEKPKLGLYMLNKMEVVDFYSPNKIYLGKRTKYSLEKHDHDRIFRVMDKYVKGLFFHEYGYVIPKEYEIKHFWINDKREKQLKENISNYNIKVLKDEIFSYGYLCKRNPGLMSL